MLQSMFGPIRLVWQILSGIIILLPIKNKVT